MAALMTVKKFSAIVEKVEALEERYGEVFIAFALEIPNGDMEKLATTPGRYLDWLFAEYAKEMEDRIYDMLAQESA